ncbi:MAG TPA: hypothetical protein VFG42_21220 [Baekduia sp.]|uniref:hypothetical protein n=1 Tax=Baekduia sp. TaxID=2600305 RepID=UPI002D77A3F5|nr:hypothetical protein [Baekduia sp.]HET6509332.1 hypothetical protein [Baekduia sp.]
MTDRPDDRPTDPRERDRERGAALGERIRELTGDIEAPASLRLRVDERRAAPARRRRLVLPAGALGALAAVVVAVVLVAGGGAAPTVGDAAALALSRPTQPAPAVDPSNAYVIDAGVGGIRFPNYTYAWSGWRAVGRRTDTISGRDATTVTYRGPQGDVGYTIVDGKPLDEPAAARWVTRDGVRYAVVRRGNATVVTWRQAGHTCVLAGRGAPGMEARLLAFAAWT